MSYLMNYIRVEIWYQWRIRHTWPDKLFFWLVYKLPRRLVYFAVIRATAEASTGLYSHKELPAITAAEVLEAWETKDPA